MGRTNEDAQAESAEQQEGQAGEDRRESERDHGRGDDRLRVVISELSMMMRTRMWKNGTTSIIMLPLPPLKMDPPSV